MPWPAERKALLGGWALVAVAVLASRFLGDVPRWILLSVAGLSAVGLVIAALRDRRRR